MRGRGGLRGTLGSGLPVAPLAGCRGCRPEGRRAGGAAAGRAGGREGGVRASRSRRGSTCPVIDCRARRAAQSADTRPRQPARAHPHTHTRTGAQAPHTRTHARAHARPSARAPGPAARRRRQPALRPRASARARPAGEMCSGSGGSVSRGLTSCPGLTLLLAEDGGSKNRITLSYRSTALVSTTNCSAQTHVRHRKERKREDTLTVNTNKRVMGLFYCMHC